MDQLLLLVLTWWSSTSPYKVASKVLKDKVQLKLKQLKLKTDSVASHRAGERQLQALRPGRHGVQVLHLRQGLGSVGCSHSGTARHSVLLETRRAQDGG